MIALMSPVMTRTTKSPMMARMTTKMRRRTVAAAEGVAGAKTWAEVGAVARTTIMSSLMIARSLMIMGYSIRLPVYRALQAAARESSL